MTTKTTGAEWKKFYADPEFWPEDAYHEDEEFTLDGASCDEGIDVDMIDDVSVVTVSGGIVFIKQSDTDRPTLENHFKRWRKKQSTVFLNIEVPKEKLEALLNAVKAAGGKVTNAQAMKAAEVKETGK